MYAHQTRSRVLADDSMVSIVLKNLQLFSQTHNIIVIWVNTLCKTLYYYYYFIYLSVLLHLSIINVDDFIFNLLHCL